NSESGQFERTLIVAEEGAYVAYLEGCTAPQFDKNQLHAAVVELIALDDAEIKYSTVQNWYAGDETGKGGIYNFVTKRGACRGVNSKISWTQVETASEISPLSLRDALRAGDPPDARHRRADRPAARPRAIRHQPVRHLLRH